MVTQLVCLTKLSYSYQAVLLLRKFLKSDIIQRADHKDETEFHDSSDELYCFTNCVRENLPIKPPAEDKRELLVTVVQLRYTFRLPVLALHGKLASPLRESTNCCNPMNSYKLKISPIQPINPPTINQIHCLPRGNRPPATVYTLPIRNRIKRAYVVRLEQQMSDV